MVRALNGQQQQRAGRPAWVKILIPVLALGGAIVTVAFGFVMVFFITAWFGNPLPVFGFDQSPDQPIPFTHVPHASTQVLVDADGNPRTDDEGNPLHGLGLDCTFCHRTVTEAAPAGIPAVETCITCHQVIGPADSEPLQALREIGLGEMPGTIEWRRVHRLPDHVRFVHEPHIRFLTNNPSEIANRDEEAIAAATQPDGTVRAAVVCSTCHGDVKTMEKVRQVEPLKMAQCVDCHRQYQAPTDCATCHH